MPSPKHPCPTCGKMIDPRSSFCRKHAPFSEAHRKNISASVAGKTKPWLQNRKRPDHSQKMKELWETGAIVRPPVRNPDARYPGLSCRRAKEIRQEVGACEHCGSTKRLDIHHRDRDKTNQEPINLMVLCHRCHMQEHAAEGETGWDSFHKKRRQHPAP